MMKQTKSRPKRLRFRAETFDLLQYLFQEYNDHQVHAVLYFDRMIDISLLEKALCCTLEIVPILGCRFVGDNTRPYWEHTDEEYLKNLFTFVDSGGRDPGDEIQRFITGKTDEKTGPQLMARVIRSADKDILCLVMNHMVCDGAGFKEYLYLLGEIYTRLCNRTYGDFYYHNGERSERQLYRNFTFAKKLKLFFLPHEAIKANNTVYFPLSRDRTGQEPFILRHKLAAERFARLKAYGKSHGFTINDIVLAAYFRALNRMLDTKQGDGLTIPCMVDLRRYLPGKKADGICNLAAMMTCRIGETTGQSFDETAAEVHAVMQRKKSGYPGLDGLSTLKLVFKLPFSKAYQLLKKYYANPLIGITNIGIIDSGRLMFGKAPIKDAYVAASIKYPPYFQLGLTTYDDSLTFTVNQYGTESDRETVQRFFVLLDQELCL